MSGLPTPVNTPQGNPSTGTTAAVGGHVVPLWLADAHDRFKADLLASGASKSTSNDYPKRAREFVEWCIATFGTERAHWPIDAPLQWYTARGWSGPSQGYRNLASSALRAAIRWDRGQTAGGFVIPDVEFPPSVAPPRRKPKTYTSQQGDPYTMSADATQPVVASPVVTPDGAPIAPPTNVTPAGTPLPGTPLPGYIAPSTDIAPGISDRPLARPRPIDKRQHVARNSLGSLLPPGGKLKIYRVSDGTDKANPGERVLFTEPTEKDVRGYNDIAVWIKDSLHDVLEPLVGQQTVTTVYIVEQYDDQERLLPPPRRILLPNRGRTPQNHAAPVSMSTPVSPAPAPGGMVDEVMKSFVKRAERYDAWQEEMAYKTQEALEKAQKGDPNAQMNFILSQRPAPLDIKALVEDVVSKVQHIVEGAAAKNNAPPMMLPTPVPVKDPLDSPLLKELVSAATRREPPPAPIAAVDPIAQITAIANIVRPPVDPAVTALQTQVQMLTNELRDAKVKNPGNDPMNFFTMMKMMDDAMDRRMQRFGGGGGGGIGEAIGEAIKALPEVVNTLANAGHIQPREGRPNTAPPQRQAPPQQQQQEAAPQAPPPATEGQLVAFRNLTVAAHANDDTGVLNALLAFIVANANAPQPWPQLNAELLAAISTEITTTDELGYVVQRLYALPAFGAGALLKEFPGAARKATDILAWNFPVICERLKIAPRELLGIPGAEAAAPTAPPAGASPNVNPKPAAPPAEEADDESDEDEDDGEGEEAPAVEPVPVPVPIETPETDVKKTAAGGTS